MMARRFAFAAICLAAINLCACSSDKSTKQSAGNAHGDTGALHSHGDGAFHTHAEIKTIGQKTEDGTTVKVGRVEDGSADATFLVSLEAKEEPYLVYLYLTVPDAEAPPKTAALQLAKGRYSAIVRNCPMPMPEGAKVIVELADREGAGKQFAFSRQ